MCYPAAVWMFYLLVLATLLVLVLQGVRIMATLADVNASIKAQTDAINALPKAAATEADLDGVKAGIDANTALLPTAPPPPTP